MRIFLLILLIFNIFYGEVLKGEAWAKVEVINRVVVIGEPIYIRLTRYGTPYGGDIYLDGKVCNSPYITPVPQMAIFSSEVKGGKRIKLGEKIKEVTYNILNQCDLRMKDMEIREYEICYKDKLVKACDSFTFEYPKGEDLNVYKKMNKEARDFTFPESGVKAEELLTHFPTSTYAGWVLLKLPHAGWGTRDKKYDEEKKRYQELVEMFLEVHPDFPYAAYLAADAGYIALEYNNYKSACQLFKKAMELTTVIELTEKTKKMYNELKKEGKCK